MDCQLYSDRISDYLDGHMVDAERQETSLHLRDCSACRRRLSQFELVRKQMLAQPTQPLPEDLRYSLTVAASRASSRRRRYAGFQGFFKECKENIRFRLANMPELFGLPMAGGLASAVVLFSMVMPNFTGIGAPQPYDVPTILATDASLSAVLPYSFEPGDVVLDILVDENGRVIDYSFPDGYGSLNTGADRRRLENSLLFTQFKPATTFGQPTVRWVRVFFGRNEIDVQG